MDRNTRFDSNRLIENRQIRIFLSSTFSDMQDERSALVKIFEKMKVTAARRNVTLSLLDLRWGVTDDEARSGKVISVCLHENEHSHPFFIGMLGNRYGYAPEPMELSKNHDLLERYPWLAKDIADGRSITEIEMLYGALRNDGHPVDAVFFIKQTSDPDDNPKLTALKEKIQCQKQYPVKNYSDVEQLCLMVEHQVNAMIDRLFPDGERTSLESERTAQRAYINSRHGHFVGREEELDYLDNFVRSDRHHLVITGDSGMGKSALLANWIRHNYENNNFNLIYHFVGNSFVGNSYESVLRHLCDEIYDIYKIEKDLNRQEKPEEESQRLVSELVNKQKPLVVIIDGINQIIATKDEKLLLWLPSANVKVKFVFTTLREDITMQTFERRGYEVLTLEALSDNQRERFAIEYLEQVGKHLDERLLQSIIHDRKNRNTLVLRTLLDELICFGSHEHLTARVEYYLSADSIPNFFDRVLQRMEQDYNNGQDLVCHVLSLIAISEHGLSEEELLAITGFRQMDWHLFYCAFFNHLVDKEGLITFSHHYVSEAIASRYSIDNAEATASYRHEIVSHFAAKMPNDEAQHQRCISELAHQYYNLKDWPNLHNILLSFEAFGYFNSINILLLTKYWRTLMEVDKEHYRLSDYLQLSEPKEETALAGLLNDIGYVVSKYFAEYNIALEYHSKALAIREMIFGMEHSDTAQSYNNIGLVYFIQGDYIKALEYYSKALVISEKILGSEHPDTITIYNNIGEIYHIKDEYDKALECHFKALETREKVLGVHPDIAQSYTNIAVVYDDQGNYSKALEYHFKALEIFEKVLGTEHLDVATSFNNIGVTYIEQGDHDESLAFFHKALAVREKVLGMEHPYIAQSYNNIGFVHDNQGNYSKALEYYFKALAIMEKILGTDYIDIATYYNNIGEVYRKQGNYDLALKCFVKALAIKERVLGTEHHSVATSFSNIGAVYDDQGNYDKALEYYFKALAIQKITFGTEHFNTAISYNNIGWAYKEQGDYKTALDYYAKAYQIFKAKLGEEHPHTKTVLGNISIVKEALGSNE